MVNLMRKELVLAMHPASMLFLPLFAMLSSPQTILIMSFAFTPAWAPFSSALTAGEPGHRVHGVRPRRARPILCGRAFLR